MPIRFQQPLFILVAVAVLPAGQLTAQSYSEAFGVVRKSITQNRLTIVSNPFNGNPDNDLNTILPLSEAAIGTTLWRFDASAQAYAQPLQYAGAAFGWITVDPDPNWFLLDPGEAVIVHALADITLSFFGSVQQGNLSILVPGNGGYSLVASPAAQSGPVGHRTDLTGAATGLVFPAASNDMIYVLDPATGAYKDPYIYSSGSGWNSLNPDDPGPNGPQIPLASGFFVRKSGIAQAWTRNFNVNSSTP